MSREKFTLPEGKLIAEALDRNFTSPNVSDGNFETANVVDTLHDIARGLFAVAAAIRGLPGWEKRD